MGGEIRTGGAPVFRVSVHGTAPIAMAEIIRGDRLAHTERGDGMDLDFTWQDPDPQPGESSYYVRVTQRDDAHAWSSPIFVTYTGKPSSSPRELTAWNERTWPDESDARRDPEMEQKAMELFRRRLATTEPFRDLRAVGLFEDHRGRYVLLRAVRNGNPIQWKIHYEYPDWRISGKGSWHTHG